MEEENKVENPKKNNWIERMAKKRIGLLSKPEVISPRTLQQNMIDQLLVKIKTKDHFSMQRKTLTKKLAKTIRAPHNPSIRKLEFQDFFQFAKTETIRISELKSKTALINTESCSKTYEKIRIDLTIIKKKFRNIVNVINFCNYILRYHYQFGCHPYFLDYLIKNEDKEKIKLYSSIHNYGEYQDFYKREEELYEDKMPWYIINPNNCFSRTWNMIILVLMINILLIGSFRICFTDNYLNPDYLSIFIFDFIVEILFLIDIIFHFFTAFTNKNNNLEINQLKIIKNYIKSWFLIDLITQNNNYTWLFYKGIIFDLERV